MKRSIFCLALCTSLSMIQIDAKENSSQLASQKSSALPAHLTTRIEWRDFPKLNYDNDDLLGQDRAAILRVTADETGTVTQVKVQESTGSQKLDDLLVKATQQAKVKPFQQDGNLISTIGYQTFNLDYKDTDAIAECIYHFNSNNWLKQQSSKSVPFDYLQQPALTISRDELKGKDRLVRFNFKVNKQGETTKVKIKKGSGIYSLDAQVMQAISHTKVEVPKKLWFFKKSNFKDEIHFKLDECPHS
ncbi:MULTISPECIES: TonB family protein [unclassified Acinetobacter]|uniref:TonB family protein n=1 Tax=unclassified Acinetobacter TaxID=196816 RepID=UPI00190B6220|nr:MULTISPECIES: TonB family protein [unclassified Acinetobacter]MBK0064559.1 TonB family protein [Acinetobacter sp. S55]MBK0067894.1 TonB family protein [Acinetobacter sp. S54]